MNSNLHYAFHQIGTALAPRYVFHQLYFLKYAFHQLYFIKYAFHQSGTALAPRALSLSFLAAFYLIFGGILPLELTSLDDTVPARELDAQVFILCRRAHRKQ